MKRLLLAIMAIAAVSMLPNSGNIVDKMQDTVSNAAREIVASMEESGFLSNFSEKVVVPSVNGLRQDEALARITNAGLESEFRPVLW